VTVVRGLLVALAAKSAVGLLAVVEPVHKHHQPSSIGAMEFGM